MGGRDVLGLSGVEGVFAEGGSGEGDVGDGMEAGGGEAPEGGVGVSAEGDRERLLGVFVDEDESGVAGFGAAGEVGGVGGGAGWVDG